MYICVTYVDAATKIPCNVAPMSTGPSYPDLQDLNIEFWNESVWPTDFPLFYGTCSDNIDTNTLGIVKVLTDEEYSNAKIAENENRLWLIKSKASGLLSATDWTQVSDCPLLNKQEFVEYRALVRAIALNPALNAQFPVIPAKQWS